MIANLNKGIGFFNNSFLYTNEIGIPVDNLAVNRGYGAFDFFGIVNRKPFYGDRHIKRFLNTLHLLKLNIEYSENDLATIIKELIEKNAASDFYLKLFALPVLQDHSKNRPASLIVIPIEAPMYPSGLYKSGAKLISKKYSRFVPEAKSTNYMPMVFWQEDLEKAGAIDILYLSQNNIRETSKGNVFCVKDNVFYTPEKDILKGVTRSVVLDLLYEQNIQCIQKEISFAELLASDEIFLSSTTKKIMPVNNIDGQIIGNGLPGEKTKKMMSSFENLRASW
jgi:branched-chain amino acid aminotransferase